MNSHDAIQWPSHNAVAERHHEAQRLDHHQQDGSSIPQFHSDGENSAFFEGKTIFGALNESSGQGEERKNDAPFGGSKQLSPIIKNKKIVNDRDSHSSFLKSGHDDVTTIQDASAVVIGNTTDKEVEGDVDAGDGILWLSKQPQQVDGDKSTSAKNVSEVSELKPKKLFVDGPDVDTQVIRKQEKTFEQMLAD